MNDYVIRVSDSPHAVDPQAWDALLQAQGQPTPFMRHAYLAALHDTGCASAATGWSMRLICLHLEDALVAACVVYSKDHSFGEYVFDWAWANAYAQHGVAYYPKAVVAVPFTPVPGARLLAKDGAARSALVQALVSWAKSAGVSSLHLLFGAADDIAACAAEGLMLRHTVQFHWSNTVPRYTSFDAFLGTLSQDKRKKILQERRKVSQAGVTFRHACGTQIGAADWDFFYRCYARTYLEHGNAPYLNREFFDRIASTLPQAWLMFIAERNDAPIACSLIGLELNANGSAEVAYGRYWGALERVDCLHFEACYYQPLQWCIGNGVTRFEGGAQGEHKMARALMPVKTTSAHWLAHPDFASAVARYLEREDEGVDNYLDALHSRAPFRNPG
jgi:predicted N-acyltransferase